MRRFAGLLVVMVLTATPMVVSACAALCAPEARHACHESAATPVGTTGGQALAISDGDPSSKNPPVAAAPHTCCAHAQRLISPVSPALPNDDDDSYARLPVTDARVHVERSVASLTTSPPRAVPVDPHQAPLVLRL